MAFDASHGLNASDALAALAPVVGAGGISGIVIAVMGYLKAARDGKPAPTVGPAGMSAIAALYADRAPLERAAQGVEELTHEVQHLRKAVVEASELAVNQLREIRRAIEDLRGSK